jgi:hypothetical protein
MPKYNIMIAIREVGEENGMICGGPYLYEPGIDDPNLLATTAGMAVYNVLHSLLEVEEKKDGM